MRNFSQRFICIIKSKKSIFLKLVISDFAASITTTTTIIDFVDVDLNEIDREEISFEFFEIDMKIEFATRETFDWITISNSDSIEIEFELKLIVNSSDLNDLKLIFERDLKLTTTSTIFNSTAFWAVKAAFFVFNACVNEQ